MLQSVPRQQRIRICTTPDEVRIAYATAGDGPPLVLVTNWLSHLQYNWESEVWRHWNQALCERNTLVRFDPRGCGLSDREVSDFSLDAWVHDLETVVDALGLARFPILGFCQGAATAVAYAARHPERVERLVLYGGYLRGAYVAGDPQMARLARNLEEVIRLGWGQETPAYQELFARLLMPDGDVRQVRCLCEQQRRSVSPEKAARLFAEFQSFDIKTLAEHVAAPTLVMHLRGDGMVPFANGRQLAAALPNARFVPLEGNNHAILRDEPAWTQFLTELREFLAEDGTTLSGEFAALTERERAVLEHIARGRSNEEIAAGLHISDKTVRNHITRIFAKLGVTRRSQAIVRARDAGFGHR